MIKHIRTGYIDKIVGKHVRERREALQLTQENLNLNNIVSENMGGIMENLNITQDTLTKRTGYIDKIVGKNIRKRRKELGITQESLAKSLGVVFQQVQKYEKGINRVSASRLYCLKHILKVDYEYFLQRPGR